MENDELAVKTLPEGGLVTATWEFMNGAEKCVYLKPGETLKVWCPDAELGYWKYEEPQDGVLKITRFVKEIKNT